MSAFASAWQILKALPEQQGYMGSLPRPIQGMMERRRAQGGEDQRGDVEHQSMRGMQQNPKTGEMTRSGPFRDEPVDEQDLRAMGLTQDELSERLNDFGEPLPQSDRRIERDISPLQERYDTMVGHSQSRSPATAGPMQGQNIPKTSMANVRGHELMPEEAFYTPREARLSREGMEQSAGRQMTGGQRGGRMESTGGSRSGINTALRGVDDAGKRIKGVNRQAAKLGNFEGVQTGNRMRGGASSEFIEQPQQEDKPPTQEERVAQLLQGMATGAGGSFTPAPAQAQEEKEPPTPRNENLRPMGGRYMERLEESKNSMGKPDLNIPQQPGMAEMFADPSGPEGQAAMENLGQVEGANRQRLMAMAKQKALEQAGINQQG